MPDYDFICHNAENLEHCSILHRKTFEIILAADVIEHLSNIGNFLCQVPKLLAQEGKLIITVPHAFGFRRFLALAFFGIEHVHCDHTGYFSIATLIQILSRYGLIIKEVYGFQWRNPTLVNRFSNLVVMPVLYLVKGRLCDELALVVEMKGNKILT